MSTTKGRTNDSLIKAMDFGNEAGDDVDNPEQIASYFVEQDTFAQFLDPNKRFLIATAKKGVGKSALIQWMAYKLSIIDPDAIIIKCKGSDLVRSRFKLDTVLVTPNDHIRDWMLRLCGLVNRELALRLPAALSDDEITLIETAELDGFKSRNLVGSLLDRFQKWLDKGQPTKLHAQDEFALLKRVSKRRAWILIDDLDATFQKTDAETVDLSTFFSACRYMLNDIKDVQIRVTLRTDVWPIIRRFDESLDKVEQYVRDLEWSQADFRKLLTLRVASEINRLGLMMPTQGSMRDDEYEDKILKSVFVPKMNWGDKDQYTYKVIYTLSYQRPRWAIQLCKLSQKSAVRRQESYIGHENIDEVWGDYGARRIADLVSEHKHQCQQIDELLN